MSCQRSTLRFTQPILNKLLHAQVSFHTTMLVFGESCPIGQNPTESVARAFKQLQENKVTTVELCAFEEEMDRN